MQFYDKIMRFVMQDSVGISDTAGLGRLMQTCSKLLMRRYPFFPGSVPTGTKV